MNEPARKKPYLTALLFGALSIASYAFLFTHVDQVMESFIKGGVYAALPIITALYFSVVHGTFASSLLSVLGIRPKGGH